MTDTTVPVARVAQPAAATGAAGAAASLLRATRPGQWVKNLLVVAAPACAGRLLDQTVLGRTALAGLAMTLVAASCYLLNDVRDRDLDRAHPVKRHRPVASGALSPASARAASVVLLVLALLACLPCGPALLVVVLAYSGLTTVYALGLKHVAWLEMAVLAAGFPLRALAGAVAVGVPVSPWFAVVVASGAVVVVAGKRASELRRDGSASRPVLARYTRPGLEALRRVATAVLLLAYVGWAVAGVGVAARVLAGLSAVPVALVLRRWAALTALGRTGAPERVLVRDRTVASGVAAWAALFAASVLLP